MGSKIPTSTYMTYLLYSEKGKNAYKKLVDIKEVPAMGGAPEMLDATTLSDRMKKLIMGIQSLDALTFPINYIVDEYATINEMSGKEYDYAVALGSTEDENGNLLTAGTEGVFKFSGTHSVYLDQGSVNGVREAKVTVAPSTEIEFETDAITLSAAA